MSKESLTAKPLGQKERALIIVALVFERAHAQAPTWLELRRATGIEPPLKLRRIMFGLRAKRLVTFTDEPRSLVVTDAGRRAALRRDER